jgi:hypothetical protein
MCIQYSPTPSPPALPLLEVIIVPLYTITILIVLGRHGRNGPRVCATHAPITPNFPFGSSRKIVGDYVEK